MSAKKKVKLTRQCRIFQWIEDQDPEFAEAIHYLCLEGALSPGSRSTGVTFLYPKDRAYRQEIVDKAYGEEADEAVKLVESLIIPDALRTAADFGRRPVGSKLGVKYAVESAGGAKVQLAGGVELAPASDFRPRDDRADRLAVWVVEKGRLPLSGEDYRAPMAERRAKGGAARRGGNEGGERQALAAATEADFDRCMRRDGCREHHPYLARVVSLLKYLRARSPEAYQRVLPVIDYDPVVSFYLLLEPFKARGEPLLPDALLFGAGAWNGADLYENAVAEYEEVFRGLPAQAAPDGAYVFRDRAAVASQIDAIRQHFASLNPRQGPQLVQSAYATLAAQNTINGMGPVLPPDALAALSGSKKLWQDELRFTLHEALQTLRGAPYEPSTFARIARDLRTQWPGNDYAAEICLSNLADLQTNVAPRQELFLLAKFVNSTDFLYLPAAPEAVGGAWGSMDPTDWQVYNRNAAALANLHRVQGMVRPSGLSPQTLQELQVYVQTHGALPPAVLALLPQ